MFVKLVLYLVGGFFVDIVSYYIVYVVIGKHVPDHYLRTGLGISRIEEYSLCLFYYITPPKLSSFTGSHIILVSPPYGYTLPRNNNQPIGNL